eukprot:349634-Chlamydomonas_euryale.AAC.7
MPVTTCEIAQARRSLARRLLRLGALAKVTERGPAVGGKNSPILKLDSTLEDGCNYCCCCCSSCCCSCCGAALQLIHTTA